MRARDKSDILFEICSKVTCRLKKMTEQKQSRRRFLKHVGAGIFAAAAVLGYLTRDYWGSLLKSTSTSTPTTHQTQQPTTTDNLTSTETTTTATNASEITTTTEAISEDEILIKKLLEEDWVNAYNSENIEGILSLYTDNATLMVRTGQYLYNGKRGAKGIINHYSYHTTHHSRVHNYEIEDLKISGDKANVLSTYAWTSSGLGLSGLSQYELVKITEETKDRTTYKLSKPIWKISFEQTST